jgi:hypothetical protein
MDIFENYWKFSNMWCEKLILEVNVTGYGKVFMGGGLREKGVWYV